MGFLAPVLVFYVVLLFVEVYAIMFVLLINIQKYSGRRDCTILNVDKLINLIIVGRALDLGK